MADAANSTIQSKETEELSFQSLYGLAFPNGSKTVFTTAANHECGLDAIVKSMSRQFLHLPQPTLDELRSVARLPKLQIENTRNYWDDELEKILIEWGRLHELDLHLGYVTGNLDNATTDPIAVLITWPIADRSDLHIVWIHNDLAEYFDPVLDMKILNHWSGLERKILVHGPAPSTQGTGIANHSNVNESVKADIIPAQTTQETKQDGQTELDPSPSSHCSLQKDSIDRLAGPRNSGSQRKQSEPAVQDENQQSPASPVDIAEQQPASGQSAPAVPKNLVSDLTPQATQPRRSRRRADASPNAEDQDQDPIREPGQQATKPKKEAPKHRYLCMIDDCTCSHNDLDHLNAHRKKKHGKGELTIDGSATCRVDFTTWLARKTRATVPASMLERWKHLLEDSSPEQSTNVAQAVGMQSQKTIPKRKVAPRSTDAKSTRPARGQGKQPERPLNGRGEHRLETQEHQSQADSSEPAAVPQSTKRKRDLDDVSDTTPAPKKGPTKIILHVRRAEMPPSTGNLTQSSQDTPPKLSTKMSAKVSSSALAEPHSVSIPAFHEGPENGTSQAKAADAPLPDSSSESSDDNATPSNQANNKESEGEHMDRWRKGYEADSQKKNAAARSHGGSSSYQWGTGQAKSTAVFNPHTVIDAIPASLYEENAAKKAAKSKKDPKSKGEADAVSPDRGPLLEANTSHPDATNLNDLKERLREKHLQLPKADKNAIKSVKRPDDPDRIQTGDVDECTDVELWNRLRFLISDTFHTRHGVDLLSETAMAEKAGRIRIASTQGGGTTRRKETRQETVKRDHDDNLLIFATLIGFKQLLDTNQQLARDQEKTDMKSANEIARLQKDRDGAAELALKKEEIRTKDTLIETLKAEIARLTDQHAEGEALKSKDDKVRALNAKVKAQAKEIDRLNKHKRLARLSAMEERSTINAFANELDEERCDLETGRRMLEEQKQQMAAETTGYGIIRTSSSLELLLEAARGQVTAPPAVPYYSTRNVLGPHSGSSVRGPNENGNSASGWGREGLEDDENAEQIAKDEVPTVHDDFEVGGDHEPVVAQG